MKHLFAIVDIETTGGFAQNNRITEIAICIHDGKKTIDQFESLINPEIPIPYSIQKLTGITNEMVSTAPTFLQLAPKIYSLLHKKVFVAHNVNFDYTFIRKQLVEVGYHWTAKKLCTVRLSRAIFPNHRSYSLGNLCKDLHISLTHRHRAMGDCEATVILFEKLLLSNSSEILKQLQSLRSIQKFPPQIDSDNIENLPHRPGVYQFLNLQGKPIYIGKAIDVKKRVMQHFSSQNASQRKQQFLEEIFSIIYEETGNELMALLREHELIQHHWPKYNVSLKKFEPKYGITYYKDGYGYYRLALLKISKNGNYIQKFSDLSEATTFLKQMIDKNEIPIDLCHFYNEPRDVLLTKSRRIESLQIVPMHHNEKIVNLVKQLKDLKEDEYLLIQKGRNLSERAFVWCKNNQLVAKGFVPASQDFTKISEWIADEMFCKTSAYTEQLLHKFRQLYPHEIIELKKELQ